MKKMILAVMALVALAACKSSVKDQRRIRRAMSILLTSPMELSELPTESTCM